MNNSKQAESKLLQLRERFSASLPRRINEIAEGLRRCEARTVTLDDLSRLFHSLAGTAGTYGVEAVSAIAAEGEEICDQSFPDADTFEYLHSLVDQMRAAIPSSTPAPTVRITQTGAGRILCVDDDPSHNQFVRVVLESAGYEVRAAADAGEFTAALAEFRPDLIVMDYVLPGVTGVDLAREVRGDAAYATVPIVFLTQRRNVEQRIEVIDVGGDDFLNKPVVPDLLLSVIASRLRRSRSVQALIDRDGLTGALNRAAMMRRVEAAVSEAGRRQVSTALVMLDLDYFKSVNDLHGHLAGDQVLVTFATFVQRNIRALDDAGRYGGEEFVLLLREISVTAVHDLLARLLDEFSAIAFRGSNDAPFHVTFSAGVAMLDRKWDVREWTRRADEALYVAKHNGRARIEAA